MRGVETIHDAIPKVLIVEDSDQQRAALSQLIARLGYQSTSTASCAESRAALSAGRFACCFIDVGLPDGRGVDLLDEFRAADSAMVPVMLTAEQNTDVVIEAMRGGAFDYLIKPIDLMFLRAALTRAMAHHNLLRERAELVALLRNERDRLKIKIDEATADIRTYAKSCEAANSLLHALLEITQLSEHNQSDEMLLGAVAKKMSEHVPLMCAAVCDYQRDEFVSASRREGKRFETIRARMETSSPTASAFAASEVDLLTSYWVGRHTGLVTETYNAFVYPQSSGGRVHCTIAFYLGRDFNPAGAQDEFLATCAHFVSYEYERHRLMVHAAQQASLGNIAIELSRSFMKSLTAMQTASDFVAESVQSEDDREALGIVRRNTELLTDQIRQFNDLAAHREDSIESIALAEFIEQTLNLLAVSIETRGVKIRTDFQTESECVLLNGSALARTFLDLISCAVRAGKRGSSVDIAVSSPDPAHVVCSINHTVASVPLFVSTGQDDRPRDFGSYANHPAYALAQRTVQSCGGKLSLESLDTGRSVFRILLPRDATSTAWGDGKLA